MAIGVQQQIDRQTTAHAYQALGRSLRSGWKEFWYHGGRCPDGPQGPRLPDRLWYRLWYIIFVFAGLQDDSLHSSLVHSRRKCDGKKRPEASTSVAPEIIILDFHYGIIQLSSQCPDRWKAQ